ncbi:MAG: flagellar export protein FliJ [Spirochaetes bacterium]|nr:flagellar export protein FliJ [Spirochaetota bacterium]
MRKYRFPLQKLLEIREHKENLIKNEMAQAQRKKIEHQMKKEKMNKKYHQGLKDMKYDEKARLLSIAKLQLYQQYFRYLHYVMDKQDTLIRLSDEEIAIIAKKLIEARKEKRVIEKLKERTFKKYQKEVAKEEQDFLDEVGTNRYAANKIKEIKKDKDKKEIEIPLKVPEVEDITRMMYEAIMSGKEEEK